MGAAAKLRSLGTASSSHSDADLLTGLRRSSPKGGFVVSGCRPPAVRDTESFVPAPDDANQRPSLRLERGKALRHMRNLHIGECVTFRDRVYLVCGFSPMSITARRVRLEKLKHPMRLYQHQAWQTALRQRMRCEQAVSVASAFWEWRNKLMRFVFTGVGGALVATAWMYDRDFGRWMSVPLFGGC